MRNGLALVLAGRTPTTVVALNLIDHSARRAGDSTRARSDDSADRTTHNSAGGRADGSAGRLLLGGARPGQQAQGGNESEFLHRLFLQAPTRAGRRINSLGTTKFVSSVSINAQNAWFEALAWN